MAVDKQIPIVVHLMSRDRESDLRLAAGVKKLEAKKPRGAHPDRKLKLLRSYSVKFICGPRDRSPWREAGRAALMDRHRRPERSSWADRSCLHRQGGRPRGSLQPLERSR